MCLYTYETFKIAKEDIVCYKLVYYNYEQDSYTTPFIYADVTNYIKSKTVWEDKLEPIRIIEGFVNGKACYSMSAGYIHAFTKPTKSTCGCERLFKCIIPKGTEYYIGLSDDICARAIKFVEEYKFQKEC